MDSVQEIINDENNRPFEIDVMEVRRLLDLGQILLDVLNPDELEYLEAVCGRPTGIMRAVPAQICLSEIGNNGGT